MDGFCDRCNMRPCYCPMIIPDVGGTRPDPNVLAEAIRSEQARHMETCPRRAAYVAPCNCMLFNATTRLA